MYSGDGESLAGAIVVATTFDRAGNTPSPLGTVKSDAQGHFEIPLPDGTYQLNAALEGYGPTAATANAGDTVSLVLSKSGVLRGHVRDEGGQPIKHFTIDVVSVLPGDAPAPPPSWSKTFDSPDGSYQADQIPAWPVMIRASADDFAPGLSSPVSVHKGDTRDVDITLGAGCTLTGTVVDKGGEALPGVLVNAESRVSAGSAMDPSLQTSTQAQSGDDGSFSLPHVPKGTLLVRSYDGDYAVTSATVEVGECAKLTPVKLTMTTGGSVTGVARSADGKALSGARVTVSDRPIGFVNATTDHDGHYRLDMLPPGLVRIELEHKGQQTMTYVQIKDGDTVKQDLSLFGGGNGEIAGTVTAGKKPVSGMRLLVAANHGRDKGIALYFPVTAEDGSFRVPSIPAGNYLVSVMSTTEGRGVQVNSGDVVRLDLDAGAVQPIGDGQPHPSRRRAAAGAAGNTPAPAAGNAPAPAEPAQEPAQDTAPTPSP